MVYYSLDSKYSVTFMGQRKGKISFLLKIDFSFSQLLCSFSLLLAFCCWKNKLERLLKMLGFAVTAALHLSKEKIKLWKTALWCVDISLSQGKMQSPISCVLGLNIMGKRCSSWGWERGSPPHGAVSDVQARHPRVGWGLTPPQDFSAASWLPGWFMALVFGKALCREPRCFTQLCFRRRWVPGNRPLCTSVMWCCALLWVLSQLPMSPQKMEIGSKMLSMT